MISGVSRTSGVAEITVIADRLCIESIEPVLFLSAGLLYYRRFLLSDSTNTLFLYSCIVWYCWPLFAAYISLSPPPTSSSYKFSISLTSILFRLFYSGFKSDLLRLVGLSKGEGSSLCSNSLSSSWIGSNVVFSLIRFCGDYFDMVDWDLERLSDF